MIISIKYYIQFSVALFKYTLIYSVILCSFFPLKSEFRVNDDIEDCCYRSEHGNDTISSFSFLSIKGKKQVFWGTRAYGNQRKSDDKASVAVVAIECHSGNWQMFYMMNFI